MVCSDAGMSAMANGQQHEAQEGALHGDDRITGGGGGRGGIGFRGVNRLMVGERKGNGLLLEKAAEEDVQCDGEE